MCGVCVCVCVCVCGVCVCGVCVCGVCVCVCGNSTTRIKRRNAGNVLRGHPKPLKKILSVLHRQTPHVSSSPQSCKSAR